MDLNQVTVPCTDYAVSVQFYRRLGLRQIVDSPPQAQPWLWREARLRDPAGNPICLFHAGERRMNPPWRLEKG